MKNFNDLIKENGFLTEDGKKLLEPITEAIQKVLYGSEMRGATDHQIRLIGSIVTSQVSEAIAQKVQRRVETKTSFQNMTDNEFEIYLKQKYGEKWNTTSLTPEEFERVPVPSQEEIKKMIEGNHRGPLPMQYFNPKQRFR